MRTMASEMNKARNGQVLRFWTLANAACGTIVRSMERASEAWQLATDTVEDGVYREVSPNSGNNCTYPNETDFVCAKHTLAQTHCGAAVARVSLF